MKHKTYTHFYNAYIHKPFHVVLSPTPIPTLFYVLLLLMYLRYVQSLWLIPLRSGFFLFLSMNQGYILYLEGGGCMVCYTKIKKYAKEVMTIFRSITLLCGIDNIPLNILIVSTFGLNMGNVGNIPWNTVNPTKQCYGSE